MNRMLLRRAGLMCVMLLALRAGCWGQTPAATPAAEASVTHLLDSLYPEGVPGQTGTSPAPAAAAPHTADVATSASTATAVPAPAGTLVVRRSRKPAAHSGGSTQTAHLTLVTTATKTTTTTRTIDTATTSTTTSASAATTNTTATRSLARDGATTRSRSAAGSVDSAQSVRLDGLTPGSSTTATLATSATAVVLVPPPGAPPNPDGVWINHATALELEHKLKLDARRARLILEFRETYGPFRTPDDLTQVSGITDDMVRTWESNDLLFFD